MNSRLISLLPTASIIQAFFQQQGPRVYLRSELAELIRTHGAEWKLAATTTVQELVSYLPGPQGLQELSVRPHLDHRGRRYTRYSHGTVSPFQVALSLHRDCYLSHATAVHLHGLGHQPSAPIYVNQEQRPKRSFRSRDALRQDQLDRIFRQPKPDSSRRYTAEFWLPQAGLLLVSGMSTGRLGVETIVREHRSLVCTSLERTLIDLTVRPQYAGGVTQVLKAYRAARDRLSVPTLLTLLEGLRYLYPYHQAIGFYLERAGYAPTRYEPLKALGLKLDFYLAHGLSTPRYDPAWRLWYPGDW